MLDGTKAFPASFARLSLNNIPQPTGRADSNGASQRAAIWPNIADPIQQYQDHPPKRIEQVIIYAHRRGCRVDHEVVAGDTQIDSSGHNPKAGGEPSPSGGRSAGLEELRCGICIHERPSGQEHHQQGQDVLAPI
jgi:hypothetical protein